MRLKLFVLFSFFIVIANASILYKNKNICIEDYYYKDSKFYYLASSDNKWYSTFTTNNNLQYGYLFDSNGTCVYLNKYKDLGVSYEQYNFLIALVAIFSGFVFMFFSVFIFIDVAKKD